MTLATLVQAAYFLAAVLFILGLKRMSSPVTARQGIVQARSEETRLNSSH